MNFFARFFGHLHTVDHHRWLVLRLCFMAGLYHQGLVHDLSKYSFTEFWPGVRYYQGDRSPISAEMRDKGVSLAWLHHKGRNRHHWQYWVNFFHDEAQVSEMPLKYVKEMACDRIAACMIYQKDHYHPSSALEFLERSHEARFIPPHTYARLHEYLSWVAKEDLKTAMKQIRGDHRPIG